MSYAVRIHAVRCTSKIEHVLLYRAKPVFDKEYYRVFSHLRVHTCVYTRIYTIDIKKVDKQLTHAMHVKDIHVNDTFIDKLTKWYQ